MTVEFEPLPLPDVERRNLFARLKSRARTYLSYTNQIRYDQWKAAWKLRRIKKDIGERTFIDRTVQVLGWNSVSIGHDSVIGEDTWLNVNHREAGRKQIVIGNNCWIGKRNFFSAGRIVELGDYCMTGIDCHFISADHRFNDPMRAYITTGVTADKALILECNVWLGIRVTVVGAVRVGRGSVIGANALVNKDVPPFSIVLGNPGRVHKRYDFVLSQWVPAADYDASHDSAIPSEREYGRLLRAQHPSIAMPLQAASSLFGDMP